MKPKLQILIRIVALCVVAVIIILVSNSYFQYISNELFLNASEHLKEVYQQADHSFVSFMKKNWGDLNDWNQVIVKEDENAAREYIGQRKDYWGFSEFYFLGAGGSYITASGESGKFDLGENAKLLKQGENAMFNQTTPKGENVTLFAVPAQDDIWNGLAYNAIAISYTNADMVASLNVDAFSGESSCFIVDPTGKVLLSTLPGGSVFKNYLSYLNGASNLSEAQTEKLKEDWASGKSGTLKVTIGGVEHYLYYQNSGYLDTVLIGVVPSREAAASLLKIQRATIGVIVIIALLVSIPVILWIIFNYREKTRKDAVELKHREKMFDVLSKNTNDIFLMIDAKNYNVDYLSPNVERLLGVSHDKVFENPRLLGESLAEGYNFMSKEDFADIPINGKKVWERQHVNHISGELMWFFETVYRENIDGNEKFLIVMSDRTREQSLNNQLREALDAAKYANESKSHFLANMSHDIRTPMNAIIGFTGLLAKDAENPEKVRSYVKKISASSHHLLSLINDVLDMSKIESGKTSINAHEFALPDVLEELHTIIHPQAKAKQQTFNIFVNGHTTELLNGDELRLNQILVNLLSNAVKYTHEGGSIDLFVEEIAQKSPQFVQLRFIVKDNGMGMTPEYLKKLFDPFTRETNTMTNRIQGTGLGMAITKNLISLMGGTIDVKSTLNVGTTFTVDLMFTPAAPIEDKGFWIDNGVKKILVVDDESQICDDIRDTLNKSCVEAVCAPTGEEAVELALRAKDGGEEFDAYILDLKLPGIDGIQTAKTLRDEIGANAPIILLTAYDRSSIEGEARQAGVDIFLSKPFFLTSFRQGLESFYAAKSITEMESDEEELAGMRFLVAEDNDLNAEVLFETLDIEGAELERAANGKEAVKMFEESNPGDYDMILMDVQMPEMNGYDATRAIRASNHPLAKTIPIIAMTANAFAEDIQEALNSGMDAHIAKPIYIDTLITLIQNMKKSRSGEENSND